MISRKNFSELSSFAVRFNFKRKRMNTYASSHVHAQNGAYSIQWKTRALHVHVQDIFLHEYRDCAAYLPMHYPVKQSLIASAQQFFSLHNLNLRSYNQIANNHSTRYNVSCNILDLVFSTHPDLIPVQFLEYETTNRSSQFSLIKNSIQAHMYNDVHTLYTSSTKVTCMLGCLTFPYR